MPPKKKSIRTEKRISKTLVNYEGEKELDRTLQGIRVAYRDVRAHGEKGEKARKKLVTNAYQAGIIYKRQGKLDDAYQKFNLVGRHGYEQKGIMQKAKEEMQKLDKGRTLGSLVKQFSPGMSIIFLAGALILVSFNLTGYAVGEAQNLTRWAGVVCFVCGLIFSFIHIKTKK